jgi:hypothetical protein
MLTGAPLLSFLLLGAFGLAQVVQEKKQSDDEKRTVRETERKVEEMAARQRGGAGKKPFSMEEEYERLRKKAGWDEDYTNVRVPRPGGASATASKTGATDDDDA